MSGEKVESLITLIVNMICGDVRGHCWFFLRMTERSSRSFLGSKSPEKIFFFWICPDTVKNSGNPIRRNWVQGGVECLSICLNKSQDWEFGQSQSCFQKMIFRLNWDILRNRSLDIIDWRGRQDRRCRRGSESIWDSSTLCRVLILNGTLPRIWVGFRPSKKDKL
jgi:hypothetical protein